MSLLAEAVSRDATETVDRAVEALDRAAEDLVVWVDRIRDPQRPWAFDWSPESLRGPNVAATNYILAAARRAGVLDRILTPEQRRALERPASD